MLKLKKIFTILAIAALLIGVYKYLGGGRLRPNLPILNSQFHSIANELARKEGEAVKKELEKNPTHFAVRRAGQELIAIDMAREADDFAQDHIVKNCGANENREENQFSYDISECDPGFFPPANLLDEWEEQVYSVRLYKFGRNGKLVPVASEAVVKVADKNPHSEAEKIGVAEVKFRSGTVSAFGTQYKLRGRVNLITQGDADYVEFVRE
jgi:hypothetical protein